MDEFWTRVADCLNDVRENATSADALIEILNKYFDPESGDAFFGGSGGDNQLRSSLTDWKVLWAEAPYYYVAQAPDGSVITYCEGDVSRGDKHVTS